MVTWGFLDHVHKFYSDIASLIECTCTLLEKEDSPLYKHLLELQALNNIPFNSWFYSCFAGIISDGSISKYALKKKKILIINFTSTIIHEKFLFIAEFGTKLLLEHTKYWYSLQLLYY